MSTLAHEASSTVAGFPGRVLLESSAVPEAGLAPLRLLFGARVEVDRVGTFLLVHRDRPHTLLRRARVLDVQHQFLPSRFEHHRELVASGGIFVWDSPSHDPRFIKGLLSRAPAAAFAQEN